MSILNKIFIIPIKTEDEWNKVFLILFTYGFKLNINFQLVNIDMLYIRYNGNKEKVLIGGFTLDIYKEHVKQGYKCLTVQDIINNF